MKWLAVSGYGVLCSLYGSVLFWFPDTLWHRFRSGEFAGIDVLLLTLLLPAIVLVGLRALLARRWRRLNPLPIALFMILGILSTGPVWMVISGTFRGDSFETVGWHDVVVLTLLFPLADLEISTYDGTLFALGASVFGLFILAGRRTHDRQTSPAQEA